MVDVAAVATAYQADAAAVTSQTSAVVLSLWRKIDPADISGSWLQHLPTATGAAAAGQTVAAEAANPYLAAVLPAGAGAAVDPAAFVELDALSALLYLPTVDAKQRIAAGVPPETALRGAEASLQRYVRTTVADTGRSAVMSGMASAAHATGYYRKLVTPSCPRCAILAGKHYRWNAGFSRHPGCDCVHIPVSKADDSLEFDASAAVEAGQIHGLSEAETKAIVELGADPGQVVNARSGMTNVGQFSTTTTGVTRRAIAGARILARDLDRAAGVDVRGRTYTNLTFDRHAAAKYTGLLRRGKTFTRLTKTGRVQQYAYRYTRTARPTPGQIVASASSRDEAVRLLTNYGYIL